MTFPVSLDELVCDTCPTRYPAAGDHEATKERARVAGWHVYDGPSLAGTRIRKTGLPGLLQPGAAEGAEPQHRHGRATGSAGRSGR